MKPSNLVVCQAVYSAFPKGRNDPAFRTEVDDLWLGITEIQAQEQVVECRRRLAVLAMGTGMPLEIAL